MKELSKIRSAVAPSATLAVNSKFKQMKAEGIPVVGFGAGEPDFDTPDHIKEAGIRAIREGQTKYTPTSGTVEARKAVAYRMKEDLGVDFDYDAIVISNGAKACLYAAFFTLLDTGDEVIVPAPYWVSYTEQIRMVGGVPVIVPTTEAQHFKMTPEQLEAAITDKTKALVLNNPSNPTGMIYSKEELGALAEVCLRHDIYIIADEIYDKLIYDGASFTSIPTLDEEVKAHTILINGVSKTYSMTGWRVGYAVAEKPVASAMSSYASHSTGAPATMAQYAAQEALEGPQDEVEAMRKVFEERRNYLVSRMNAMDGVSCLTPNGAFYVMMNLEQLFGKTIDGEVIATADDFARLFLEKSMVAVVSCTAFGAPSFVRWSYATSMENIQKGMDRLEQFLAKVKAQN